MKLETLYILSILLSIGIGILVAIDTGFMSMGVFVTVLLGSLNVIIAAMIDKRTQHG